MRGWPIVVSLVALVGCATMRGPLQDGEVRVARLRALRPSTAGVDLVFEGVEKQGPDIAITEACVTWLELVRNVQYTERAGWVDAEVSDGPYCVPVTENPSERTVSARVVPRGANLFTMRGLLNYRYGSEPRESNVVTTSVNVR